jgi:hypothetical protein
MLIGGHLWTPKERLADHWRNLGFVALLPGAESIAGRKRRQREKSAQVAVDKIERAVGRHLIKLQPVAVLVSYKQVCIPKAGTVLPGMYLCATGDERLASQVDVVDGDQDVSDRVGLVERTTPPLRLYKEYLDAIAVDRRVSARDKVSDLKTKHVAIV